MENASIIGEIIQYGGIGIGAIVFYKLFNDERTAHEETRKKLIESLELRNSESKETIQKVIEPIETVTAGIKQLSDKIETSKGGR